MYTRLALVCVATVSVSAALVAQAPAAKRSGYVPPKTAWGDPDLQGFYTNKYEQGTPFEKPAEFEGKKLADVQGDALAAVVKQRQDRAIANERFLSGDPTGAVAGPVEFRDLFEVKKASRPWMVTDDTDGRIPPMTPDAQKRIAARRPTGSSFSNGVYDSYESLSLYDRCITRGYPNSLLPAIYGDSYQIVQGPGYVAIRIEMIHDTRIIPLGGQPRLSKKLGFDFGDPRGHWDGNTLVVETTNFRDRSVYRNGNPETFRLIERFTPTSKTSLEWTVTVDDPATWTKPWSFSLPLTVNNEEPPYEYACHEGNYALRNILSASRLADAESAKAIAK
ncbi:MAG TPA: hypothetical protein VG871_06335 [Vicinamibacterales bacterium]|nr:hypothetical protein [Vicinamibacterales bacterium]